MTGPYPYDGRDYIPDPEKAGIVGYIRPKCKLCDGTGIMPGDPTAPPDSILRVDVPCPKCRPDA